MDRPTSASSVTALVRVIAATVTGHAVLYLGARDATIIQSMLAGSDITTRVLALATDAGHCQRLREEVPADLRLSIHHQAAVSFLDDVAAHQFGLMIIDSSAGDAVEQALALLAPAGVALGLGQLPLPPPCDERIVCAMASAAMASPQTTSDVAWLASRRARPAPQRRGGRRARLRGAHLS